MGFALVLLGLVLWLVGMSALFRANHGVRLAWAGSPRRIPPTYWVCVPVGVGVGIYGVRQADDDIEGWLFLGLVGTWLVLGVLLTRRHNRQVAAN